MRHSPRFAIREISDDLVPSFFRLNAERVEAIFSLEDEDRRVLSDPRGVIVNRGGVVLFVETSDLGIVGTGALMRVADGIFEVAKTGVPPRLGLRRW